MATETEEDNVRRTVEIEGDTPVFLYESDRDVSMEEIKDHCEANDLECPEENSSEYWDMVSQFQRWDYEDLIANLKHSSKVPAKVIILGHCGLWFGDREIVPEIIDMSDPEKFLQKFAVSGDYHLHLKYDKKGLYASVCHHDGTNVFRIREVTDAGLRYLERCERMGVPSDLVTEEPYSRKIDYWLY